MSIFYAAFAAQFTTLVSWHVATQFDLLSWSIFNTPGKH
jgi:hypothetical protein